MTGMLGMSKEAAANSCTVINHSFAMPSQLIIPRDLPVGAQIGSDIITGTYMAFNNCIKTTPGWFNVGIGTNATFVQKVGNANMYATGIPGVSYSLAAEIKESCSSVNVLIGAGTFLGSSNMRAICGITSFWKNLNYQYTLRFYKTAAVTGSGNVGSLAAGYAFAHIENFGFITPNANLTVTGIAVKTTTCSVSSSVINVPLTDAKFTSFKGIGSTTGDTAFNIGLNNCDAGLNVKMTLSPGSSGSPNENLGLLTADGTSTTSGLALQLLYKNTPVKLNSAFSVLDTVTTSSGSYQIPFVVRYYKNAESITAGRIKSNATFTMVYN